VVNGCKEVLKVYSIIFLLVQAIVVFEKSGNKNFYICIKNSIEVAFIVPIIIFLFNV
jgi:hypothetical protein